MVMILEFSILLLWYIFAPQHRPQDGAKLCKNVPEHCSTYVLNCRDASRNVVAVVIDMVVVPVVTLFRSFNIQRYSATPDSDR